MSVRIGDPAPPFSLPARPGDVVDVGAIIGREPLVMLFFPLAFSPVCTEEMCRMRDDWSAWSSLGVKVFGISVDSPFITDRFRNELSIPFPILSDFNRDVSTRYGALHEELLGLRGVSKRSAFVVGRDGRVRYAWVSEDPRAMPDFEAIRRAVAAETAAAGR
ncbi:MAG: redoxin domain-containing protein [Phycisphaeraceae bacterium]|nr:redoxin domain-containing protein [Phycisphaeraceae bacterium]